jgi:hypothetical protein
MRKIEGRPNSPPKIDTLVAIGQAADFTSSAACRKIIGCKKMAALGMSRALKNDYMRLAYPIDGPPVSSNATS